MRFSELANGVTYMKFRILILAPPLFMVSLLIASCSHLSETYYQEGDLETGRFAEPIPPRQKPRSPYYAVARDKQHRPLRIRYFNREGKLQLEWHYEWKGSVLKQRTDLLFFPNGRRRMKIIRRYKGKALEEVSRHYYTRTGNLDRIEIYRYREGKKPYLRLLKSGSGQLISTTYLYYDPAGRLDKTVENFYSDGTALEDIWTTVYDNFGNILTEEHYLPGGRLITLYRYTYDPVYNELTQEEIRDERQGRYVLRRYGPQELLLEEEYRDKQMQLIKRIKYVFDAYRNQWVAKHYNGQGELQWTQVLPVKQMPKSHLTAALARNSFLKEMP